MREHAVDESDQATEQEMMATAWAIKAAQAKVNSGPQPTGNCLHCGEPVENRWCDADCRDDWEKRNAR